VERILRFGTLSDRAIELKNATAWLCVLRRTRHATENVCVLSFVLSSSEGTTSAIVLAPCVMRHVARGLSVGNSRHKGNQRRAADEISHSRAKKMPRCFFCRLSTSPTLTGLSPPPCFVLSLCRALSLSVRLAGKPSTRRPAQDPLAVFCRWATRACAVCGKTVPLTASLGASESTAAASQTSQR
jgi:hypothetical protein